MKGNEKTGARAVRKQKTATRNESYNIQGGGAVERSKQTKDRHLKKFIP